MDPELDPDVMQALADAILPLCDMGDECAVHFHILHLTEDGTTDIKALQDSFVPRSVGFTPIPPQALHQLMTEILMVEVFELRFFNLDAGRVTVRLDGNDLSIAAESPITLIKLAQALADTEPDADAEWEAFLALQKTASRKTDLVGDALRGFSGHADHSSPSTVAIEALPRHRSVTGS